MALYKFCIIIIIIIIKHPSVTRVNYQRKSNIQVWMLQMAIVVCVRSDAYGHKFCIQPHYAVANASLSDSSLHMRDCISASVSVDTLGTQHPSISAA